jgi:hypothetical protein
MLVAMYESAHASKCEYDKHRSIFTATIRGRTRRR